MFFDLRAWFAAYENMGSAVDTIRWVPIYGDKIPVNRKQKFDEIMTMLGAGSLVSAQWARKELSKIGFELGDDAAMAAQIAQEQQASLDLLGARIDNTLTQGGTGVGQTTVGGA